MNLKQAGITAGVMTVMIVGGYMIYNHSASTERNAAAIPTPTIELTTAGAKPITFQMSSATVDVMARKKQGRWEERDLTDPEVIAEIKAVGMQRFMHFADASIMNYAYYLAPPQRGNGYNGRQSDFATIQEFNDWGGGILAASFPSDFLDRTITFANSVGVKSDVTINKRETWAQAKAKIDKCNGEYIKLGSEIVTTKYPNEMNSKDYLAWARGMRDSINKYFTGKKIIAEQPVLYKPTSKVQEFRKYVNPDSLKGMAGARVYWQINDQAGFTVVNQDGNIDKIKVFFNDTVPSQIRQFQTLFPGWKIFGTEVVVVDNRPEADSLQFINKSMVGVYAVGRFAQSFIENQDIQPMCIQMSLKGLLDPTENNTKAWTLVNKLFNPDYKRIGVTFTLLDGLTGAALQSTANAKSYALLLNNSSKNAYTLTSIQIDGKKKTPSTYILQRMYAPNWEATSTVTKDSISSATISIPACSVNLVTFTTGTGTATETKPASINLK